MRKLVFISLICGLGANAQNLVPNYSFEDYIICDSRICNTPPWQEIGSPDVFRVCDTTFNYNYNVPSNKKGYMWPRTGDAYVGISLYSGATPNYRELFYTHLFEELKDGKKYIVTFYVSLADSSRWAISEIGVHFSQEALSYWQGVVPQITTPPGLIMDNMKDWVCVQDTFVAAGREKYITIGNFKDDASVDTLSTGVFPSTWIGGSYYYFDDISVVLYEESNSVEDREYVLQPNIFPNPATNRIFISNAGGFTHYLITDVLGNAVFPLQKLSVSEIDISRLPSGLYFIGFYQNEKPAGRQRFVVKE